MADSQKPLTKERLQALLTGLLAGVSDDDLQKLQTQIDQPELRAADGHHDHDHPKLV